MTGRQGPRPFRSSRAFLVRSADAGESDVRLSLFTEEAGLVTVMAKAARRSRKRFGGAAIQRYFLLDVGWTEGGGKMGTLTHAAVLRSYWEIVSDWEKVRHADYLLELAASLFPQPGPAPSAFAILLAGFDALLSREPPAAAARKAEAAFLWAGGWGPNLSSCRKCGGEAGPFRFDAESGGLLCRTCFSGRGTSLSLGAVKTWRAMQLPGPPASRRLRVSESILIELQYVMSKYLEWCLGKRLRSLGAGPASTKP